MKKIFIPIVLIVICLALWAYATNSKSEVNGNDFASEEDVQMVDNESAAETQNHVMLGNIQGTQNISEGLSLVTPAGPELRYNGAAIWDRELSSRYFTDVFYIRQLDSRNLTKCENFPDAPEKYQVCLPTDPSNYNEFIVLDKQKNPLYQFQLSDGYSFVPTFGGVITVEPFILVGGGVDLVPTITFVVYRLSDINPEKSSFYKGKKYTFYPRTGELESESELYSQ
ncbi:hypothetical protein KC887_03270 [Candidatus Kaiserbacteria bacterium]|nr:hypothetical protein [Candidatus Kaiserbacteria bacterium]